MQTAPTSSETTVATTSADPSAGLWDPCTLPDSALSAAGLNTSTKEKDVAGVNFEGWRVCSWLDSSKRAYSFTVSATDHTLEEARARTDYTDFVDTTVGSRPALQSRPTGTLRDACFLSVRVPTGLVEFHVRVRVSAKDTVEPCGETQRLAAVLAGYLPSR
ncbi:hypothetical protein NCAST_33_01990 [Nocardia asteroides NBRC 15531]|uniref:DUF3558 domain-containing protein n=1 Tax=Nocardia asteroides NBRC 15531 TaxID=1110697 RepID=U5EHP5_NOCAS|nr:hypothetical protein [Nocardia asteroides NBRC 15531]GAD86820.1 hypothetical protein NCAST_33_01990 [Nocardia asteroides NBRC 15531]